jgi:hypothetical protein
MNRPNPRRTSMDRINLPRSSSNLDPTYRSSRPDPIHIRHVPAPLPTPAPSTPPQSGDPISKLPVTDTVELVSRPPTPAPSPTLESKYMAMDIEEDVIREQGVDTFLEKGKARARDGELVGPDLRRQSSDNGELVSGRAAEDAGKLTNQVLKRY